MKTVSLKSTSNEKDTLEILFKPRSLAVIGASRTPGKIGFEIIRNLVEFGYQGKIFPVNPNTDFVHSMKCYSSIEEIPDAVDVAIIIIPKSGILDVVDACGRKRVQGLIVITAGFREVGQEGAQLEKELIRKVKQYHMRMIGPNCMGVINTAPDVRMNATFAYEQPLPGVIGFITQSGALGAAILSLNRDLNLGFSLFASIGNKANVSSNDLLELLERDERTRIILLYLENFGNPRKFTEITRRITRHKPIIAVKSGRTLQGSRAALSHTGAIAGTDLASDALFEQCGIIRAQSIHEMFDLAMAFISQPLPKGRNVAILTNAGGPGIMATDACVSLGLNIAELSDTTRQTLRSFLPDEASVVNPVDMIASATTDDYIRAMKTLIHDPKVDSLMVINVPPIMADPVEFAVEISRNAQGFTKPVVSCLMGVERVFRELQRREVRVIPIYPFPEAAAHALYGITRFAELKERPHEEPIQLDVDKDRAERILLDAWQEGRHVLNAIEAQKVLQAYGLAFPPYQTAVDLEGAIRACRDIGYPVVMKMLAQNVVHKSDVGGVIVDIRNDGEAVDAFMKLKERLKHFGSPEGAALIQPMLKNGTEIIAGVTTDPVFGPLLMFGMGGIYVEILKDVAFRVLPVAPQDVREMIRSIRAFPILEGARNREAADITVIENVLMRLAALAMDFPGIREVEVNPFLVGPPKTHSWALDARIILGNPPHLPIGKPMDEEIQENG